MKDLTEAQLIEMEHASRQLAQLATDYENDSTRQSWDSDRRENARYDMKELAVEVSADMETLCEHFRAVSIESQKAENAA